MFGNLSERLSTLTAKLGKQAKITEENIQDVVREIRMALLEADVALPVVKDFTNKIREQAIGTVVSNRLNPGQVFVKIVIQELVNILGGGLTTDTTTSFSFARTKPIVVLLAGLQGAGKTTTAAKLGLWCKRHKHTVLLSSTDVYRPAAMEQLASLCKVSQLRYVSASASDSPIQIARNALQEARVAQCDVCIIDTAGRTAVDAKMMQEIAEISQAIEPSETFFVADAMTGQEAANTAATFAKQLQLTGIILTKVDGDARGGAALSIASVAKCPVRFAGVGEKIAALETFNPTRMAKRILGMGDVISAIEQAEVQIDKDEMARLERKIRGGKGKTFDFFDYRTQLTQIDKIGDIGSLLGKIPGLSGKIDSTMVNQVAGQQTNKHLALINSMTNRERAKPELINSSRKKRIAKGAGLEIVEVNRLLKQHKQMSKMMHKVSSKGGMRKLMQKFQQFGGS